MKLGFSVLAHNENVPFVPVLAGGPACDPSLPSLEGIPSCLEEMEVGDVEPNLLLPACQEITSSIPMASELVQVWQNYSEDDSVEFLSTPLPCDHRADISYDKTIEQWMELLSCGVLPAVRAGLVVWQRLCCQAAHQRAIR